MTVRVCQAVLLALLATAAAGCFLAHGREDAPPVPTDDPATPPPGSDAGRPPPAPDAGRPPPTRPDAGSPPGCDLAPVDRRIDRACVPGDQGALPAGSNATLAVMADGCFCTETLECETHVEEPGIIHLTTRLCPTADDCDGCVPSVTASCAIPPLSEGTWQVVVNGLPAFDVEVRPPEPGLLGERVCYDVAPETDGSLWCDWPGDWHPTRAELCHVETATAGEPVPLRISDLCAVCYDQPGYCGVSVVGNEIRVGPRIRRCDCPTCLCAETCTRVERTCHTPPLEPGVYRVLSPFGETTLRVVEPGRDAPPVEVCAITAEDH